MKALPWTFALALYVRLNFCRRGIIEKLISLGISGNLENTCGIFSASASLKYLNCEKLAFLSPHKRKDKTNCAFRKFFFSCEIRATAMLLLITKHTLTASCSCNLQALFFCKCVFFFTLTSSAYCNYNNKLPNSKFQNL